MLNRRILRIKAFKTLYGYAVTGKGSLIEATAELDASCVATRDLYLFMLAIIPRLAAEADARQKAAMAKFSATEQELNPNEKFVRNRLSAFFAEDTDFLKFIEKKNLSWEPYDLIVKSVFDSICTKKYYNDYMESETSSIKQDCKLFIKIFEEEFVDREDIRQLVESMSIFWSDDLAYALSSCCRTLEDMAKGRPWKLPDLYLSDIVRKKNPDADVDSDKEFVHKLLRCAYSGFERYSALVTGAVPDWDEDRIFSTDLTLVVLGLAEAENFPEIPDNVSINEYVEISKYYSSPKSRQFVNGLLDKLIKQIRNNNQEQE